MKSKSTVLSLLVMGAIVLGYTIFMAAREARAALGVGLFGM